MNDRNYNFCENNIVTDEYSTELSPIDDDYEYYEDRLLNLTDPLSDDYCKYDNE